MPTDTTVNALVINKLTKAQYDEIQNPSPTELYLVPDEIDNVPTSGSDNPVKSGGIYTKLEEKQDTIDSSHKLSADLVDDSSSTNKFTNATEKTTWNGKQAKITASGILKGDGNGGISAALKQDIVDLGIPGTDTNTTYKLKIGSTTNGDSVNGVDLGTLENKAAASGGTDLSLVTTGEKYAWNNKASLDENGKVPSSQLPSYIDDVIDLLNITDTAPSTCEEGDMYYNSTSAKIYTATGTNTWGSTGETPEHSKIYVNLYNNKSYRWSGTAMVEIASCDIQGVKVGSSGTPITPSQGYIILPPYESGAQVNTITGVKGSSEMYYRTGDVNITPANIGLGNVDNTADANKSVAYATTAGSASASDVYTWAKQSTKPSYTANEVKAVSTEASQGLTETEKNNARTNLGLGSMATKSSLAESDIPSISKSKISDFPTSLPANGGDSATVNGHTVLSDVPANAVFTDTWRPLGTGATDACAGNDSRLSDARVASNILVNSLGVTQDMSFNLSLIVFYMGEISTGCFNSLLTNSTSTDYIVTVPNTYTGYTVCTPDGNPIELTCPAGGYCEVSVVKNGTILFIRGI